MANSVGSAAKSSSRLCFTLVNVTTPTAPRTPLPTKFAVAEKHMACRLPCENYTYYLLGQNILTKHFGLFCRECYRRSRALAQNAFSYANRSVMTAPRLGNGQVV